jgi:hypothetical protein
LPYRAALCIAKNVKLFHHAADFEAIAPVVPLMIHRLPGATIMLVKSS